MEKSRDYVYSHLCDYDVFVLPSRSEGFGLSVVEAMCAKVPLLVCDQDGVIEVIDRGQLGNTFKTGDVGNLAKKLLLFIMHGPNIQQVNDAFRFAISNFDIQQTAERYIKEYKKLI